MKIAELLLETGDKPHTTRPQWRRVDDTMDEMLIKLPDGRRMTMYFEYEKNWAVFSFLIDDMQYVTGGGDAFRIFSTAYQAMVSWIRMRKPTYLVFTGDAEKTKQRRDQTTRIGRLSLYDRITQKMTTMPVFQGWTDITNRPDLWPAGLDIYMDNRNPGINLKTYVLASPQAFAQSR